MCFSLLLILFVAFLFSGCSSNDDNIPFNDPSPSESGILSFSMLTSSNFNGTNIPGSKDIQFTSLFCSDLSPSYIRIALKDSDGNCYVGNNSSGFSEIQLDSFGIDSNNDGVRDTWNNLEEYDLILPVGTYTLEYFAAIDRPGQSSNIIYMSPRKNTEDNMTLYYNLVSEFLPITIVITDGQKVILPVEVLCFQKELAFNFGFIFIPDGKPNPVYLCSQ